MSVATGMYAEPRGYYRIRYMPKYNASYGKLTIHRNQGLPGTEKMVTGYSPAHYTEGLTYIEYMNDILDFFKKWD